MKRLLLSLSVSFLAVLAFGQTAPVRTLDTRADLIARVSTPGETIAVRNFATNIPWSEPRVFVEYNTSVITNTNDGVHYITNARPNSIYVSNDRFAGIQDPAWWGADPNDNVADHVEIQAALDYSTNRIVKLSAGVYRIGATLVIPENTTLKGEGSGRNGLYNFVTNTTELLTIARTVVLLQPSSNVPMLTNSPLGTFVRTGTSEWDGRGTVTQRMANVRIEGILLDGNASEQTRHDCDAIRFTDRWSLFLDDVVINRPSGYFINLWNCNLVHVFDCGFDGDGSDTKGIFLFDTADLIFSGPQMGGGVYGPMLHVATGTSWLNTFYGLHFGDTLASDISGEILSVSTNVMTLSRDPLVETGDPVLFWNPVGVGFLPTGPVAGQTYFAIRYGPTTYGYSDTLAGALGGTNSAITTAGSSAFFGVGPGCGLLLSGGAQFNTVSDSRFDNGHRASVALLNASRNVITGNIISRPGYNGGGTRLDAAGVWVQSGQSNIIANNDIIWSTRGIQVDSGTHIIGPNQFYDVDTNWVLGSVQRVPAMAGTDGSLTVAGAIQNPLQVFATNSAQLLKLGRKGTLDQDYWLSVTAYESSLVGTNVLAIQDVPSARRALAIRGNHSGAELILGDEYSANRQTNTIRGANPTGSDIAGAPLIVGSGASTGNQPGGDITFETSDAGASGTGYRSKTAKLTISGSGGVTVRNGDAITFGGVSRTNWPTGFTFADLTNSLQIGTNLSAVYTSSNMTISATGGGTSYTNFWADLTNSLVAGSNISFAYGSNTLTISASTGSGATNGTAVSVDGAAALSAANFADASKIGFSASGSNVTATIVADSLALGDIDATTEAYFLNRTNHTGTQNWTTIHSTPTTLSGYGITDAQPLDSDLTRIANVTWAEGDFVYRDSVGLTNFASTAAGRTLLAAVDAAAQRTALGLGAMALKDDAPTNSNAYVRSNGTWAIAGSGGSGTAVLVNGTNVSNPNFRRFFGISDATNVDLLLAAGANISFTTNSGTLTIAGASGSGDIRTTTAVTSDYTATDSDSVLWVNASTADVAVTLPGVPSDGRFYTIIKTGGIWDVTVDDGVTTYTLADTGQSITLVYITGYGYFSFGVQSSSGSGSGTITADSQTITNIASSAFITNAISGQTSTLNLRSTTASAVLGTDASTNITWLTNRIGKTIASFRAPQYEPPTSSYATLSTRNGIGTLRFDEAVFTSARFRWLVPDNYNIPTVTIVLKWTTSATSGDGTFVAKNARLTGDIDSLSFGSSVTNTVTTSSTAGTVMTTTLTGVSTSSAVAGDWVYTDIARIDDTINSNDLELHAVEVRAE